jgi:hypothetical protein
MLICKVEANIILGKTEALLVGSNKIDLEVNAVKTKYLVMSRDQIAR